MIQSLDPIGIDLSRLTPVRDQVLIQRIWDPEAVGGIIIPDVAKQRPHRGTVVKIGRGRPTTNGTYIPMQVHLGQIVQYQSADVDAGEFVLIQEADILFIEDHA